MPDEPSERREFYVALGRALNAWQTIEGQAYIFFNTMMRGTPKHLASVTFHHVQSFDSRLQLLDKCAYFAVPKPLQPRWRGLRNRLEAQIRVRNRIVHFTLGRDVNERKRIREFNLGPSHFDSSYAINDRWKNPEFKMNRERLIKAEGDFQRLRDDLAAFEKDLRAAMAK